MKKKLSLLLSIQQSISSVQHCNFALYFFMWEAGKKKQQLLTYCVFCRVVQGRLRLELEARAKNRSSFSRLPPPRSLSGPQVSSLSVFLFFLSNDCFSLSSSLSSFGHAANVSSHLSHVAKEKNLHAKLQFVSLLGKVRGKKSLDVRMLHIRSS